MAGRHEYRQRSHLGIPRHHLIGQVIVGLGLWCGIAYVVIRIVSYLKG